MPEFKLTRRTDGLFPPQTPAELEAQGLAHAIVDFQIEIAELRAENAASVDKVTEACNLIAEFITTIGYLPDMPLLLVDGGEDALDSLIQRARAFIDEQRELVTVTFPTYAPEPGIQWSSSGIYSTEG